MLTEKQAWELLARLWSEPEVNRWSEKCVTIIKNDPSKGLCDCITDLYVTDQITDRIHDQMIFKVADHREEVKSVDTFLWPHTEEGAKARMEFCKTQGEKC